ncbi:MAG TPA: hypothetical protein VN922_15735 [Bacteroidia bacterium]|nr:hypothetical protein [Bacteroidia bacterium]
MATNPYFTQYHTQRFSLIGSPQQRDGTYSHDQRFVNMYPELIKSPISDGKKYYLKKRPGMNSFLNFGSSAARGLFYWAGHVITCVNNLLYFDSTVVLVTPSTSSGPVGFAEFRTDSADILFFCDGVNGWTLTTGGVPTAISDANFPNPHVPNPIFLDGYIFLASTGSQTIHNSNLNDPTTWPSDGFIDAEMFPDNIVALTKAQNYLVAVGTASCEFFYDNANATGSPLQRNAPAVSQFGCPAPMTVNQTEKQVILVGSTQAGGRTVWTIDGFQPTEIANEPVREALDLEITTISQAQASVIQCAGHKWYVLNLYKANRTFVYDFEEQMWHEWTSGTGQQCFQWVYLTDSTLGYPIGLNLTTGEVAGFFPGQWTDNGNTINCDVITAKIDFDTEKRKRFFRLSLVGDAPNGDSNVPVIVYWSDDDYTTWSTGTTLNLNATYPTITQLGYSRRRAFRFNFQQPYSLRLESFEVDIVQEVRR